MCICILSMRSIARKKDRSRVANCSLVVSNTVVPMIAYSISTMNMMKNALSTGMIEAVIALMIWRMDFSLPNMRSTRNALSSRKIVIGILELPGISTAM